VQCRTPPKFGMDSDEKRVIRAVSLVGLADVAVAAGLCATWFGLAGGLVWFLDLFSHFRFQLLAFSIVGLAWFLWRGLRTSAAFALITMVVNAALLSGVFSAHARTPASVSPGFQLRVLSINVHTSNRAHGKVIDFIRQEDADAVLLLEIDRKWEEALSPLKDSYPFSIVEPRSDNFGIAFFSKSAAHTEVLMFANPADEFSIGVPVLVALMPHQGRTVRLVGAHPLPPIGGRNSRWRDDELSKLATIARRSAEPVLLLGDLNATPWSAGMRALTGGSGLLLPSARFTWQPSWMADTPLAIPIDHALATAPLVVLRREIGPDVGSDHRPIIAEVGWAAEVR